MHDLHGETSTTEDVSQSGISLIAAVSAGVGALVLAVLFYWTVGFPANIPLAFGAAVLLAEVVELIVRGHDVTPWRFARAFVHGLAVAGACWLGVWIASLLGLS